MYIGLYVTILTRYSVKSEQNTFQFNSFDTDLTAKLKVAIIKKEG